MDLIQYRIQTFVAANFKVLQTYTNGGGSQGPKLHGMGARAPKKYISESLRANYRRIDCALFFCPTGPLYKIGFDILEPLEQDILTILM